MNLMRFLAALLLAGGIAHAQINNLTPGVGTSNFYTATSQSTGTNNAQIVTSSAGNFSLAAGNAISFVAGFTNSGAMTINVDGTGNVPVHLNGVAVAAGATNAGQASVFVYNGASFDVALPSYVTPASIIAPGTTAISPSVSGDILYDNAGVLGEKAVTGTGSVVLGT